jgi:hypothetical protein
MQIQVDEAIILEVKERSFKGRDGKDVTYTQVRFVDDDNQYQEATLAKDLDFSEVEPRSVTSFTLDVTEVDNRLKKRIVEA